MDPKILQVSLNAVLALAKRQHGPFTREQLLGLGMSADAIRHRLVRRRLFQIYTGVYALVPASELSQRGQWMAATLACGPRSLLSDESAACLGGFRTKQSRGLEVTVPPNLTRTRSGILIHRRVLDPGDATRVDGIPVTRPNPTLVALAARLPEDELERAISEAVFKHRTTIPRLLAYLETIGPRAGVGRLRALLTRHTFLLTDSELERRFSPIAVRAGLPKPLSRQYVNGYRVDFYFPTLGLVVETDGGIAHASAIKQTTDRLRDQAHTAAGLTQLRFTHWQIRYDPQHVETTLARVAKRLELTLLPPP